MNFTSMEVIQHKVFIIGTGLVGMSFAITILLEGVSDELASVDVDESKLQGETVNLKRILNVAVLS